MMHNHRNVRRGVQIPQTHTRLLTNEALIWAQFTLDRARMRPETVWRKAIESVAFCLQHRTLHLAVPTKLVGTKDRQAELRALVEAGRPMGHRLVIQSTGELMAVSDGAYTLGFIQSKHAPWLRPLVPFGASVHLLTVTGIDDPMKIWGVNVAIAFVAPAIERMTKGGGDGATAKVEVANRDVRLWRDDHGAACMNIPHVVRHSPTGIEWGYGGSGPTDLALSILRRFTDPDTADRLYRRFKDDVIATLPREGGLIQAAFVVSWLSAHGA